MIQLHNAGLPQVIPQEPVKEIVKEIPSWIVITGVIALLVIALLLYGLFNYHKRLTKTVSDLKRLVQNFEFYAASDTGTTSKEKNSKSKAIQEKKISELTAELEKEKEINTPLCRNMD